MAGILAGKVTLVTGGGSGIGEAVCVAFSREGAKVAVVDVDEAGARRVARAVNGLPIVADVSDSTAVDSAVAEAESKLGPLDVLVNNAGVGGSDELERMRPAMSAQMAEAATGKITTPLEATVSVTDAEWHRMLSVHLFGTFYGTRAALRSMGPRHTGSIINMASICGLMGCTGSPAYSAAKGGIVAFTRAVGQEVAVQGVRVNVVCPGFIDTPMAAVMSDEMTAGLKLQTPAGRFGTSEEVAATVVFLASDSASFYVGATLSPNGGILTAM
jgi:3-oxoacyl-[acyl-carrier protein] reductase